MKAKEIALLEFVRAAKQFVVPIYQRPYRWDGEQCRRLWQDVLRAGRATDGSAHFVGSVVYIQAGAFSVADQPWLLVIDGQQRLTTFMLIIEALAREQERRGNDLPDDFAARKLRHYHLKDTFQEGDRAYKMLLSSTDRATLKAVIDGNTLPDDHSLRLIANFTLFQTLMHEADLVQVSAGLRRVMIVDIALERGHDNPQLIFESLNSTGKALGQADLIRNYVLMDLPTDQQNTLYENHWRHMEVAFGQEAYAYGFDGFMRHYLTMKTGQIPRIEDVYDTFKTYAREQRTKGAVVSDLVAEVHRYGNHYCRMALGRRQVDKALDEAFSDIRDLQAEVTYPFLLHLLGDHETGTLTHPDLLAILRLVEAYLFRRIISRIPTNSHNKTFAAASRAIVPDDYLRSVQAHFQSLPAYRRFASDEEFVAEFKTRDLYNMRLRTYWLRRLENHDRRERVAVEEYTIEHILPQNENLRQEWKDALGPDWKRVQESYLHTLGNLTLTGYNSELSDRPFLEKQAIPGGFREAPIRLSQELRTLKTWNEETIKARADRLAKVAVEVWRAPKLSADELSRFSIHASLTVNSKPLVPSMSAESARLLTQLRKRIMAFSEAVVEELGDGETAWTAEKVFASVAPIMNQLTLRLNVPPQDLQDGRGLGRDISDVGHSSGASVELDVTSKSDMDYVTALIRQAFEWQMEAVGDD